MSEVTTEIRDSNGKWLNSGVFREEGVKFMQNKYYCSHLKGTPSYREYWDEQLKRCEKGYEVGGWKITGHHYEYLNFTQIQIVAEKDAGDKDSKKRKKVTKNPDFWDGDFDYYWCLEIATNGVATKDSLLGTELEKMVVKELPVEEAKDYRMKIVERLKMRVIPHRDYLTGGMHMIVGKSRRKGYSFKNAAICANVYNTQRDSLTVIGAFDKKYLYPEGTMGMVSDYLSFLNTHTAWAKGREYVDKQEHKRASFRNYLPNGTHSEAGYMSQVMAISFKDNPDAARGKDGMYVLFEEAGKFPNLEASFKATIDSLTAGMYVTGTLIIFGTGGDMESGTVDFAKMFYNPLEFNLMPFLNIWDDNGAGTYCGFFHPTYLNCEGFYDEQGNSDIDAAIKYEKDFRDNLRRVSTSTKSLEARVQEHPMGPSEAFLTVSMNDFPAVELRAQINKIKTGNLHLKYGQPTILTREPDILQPDGTVIKGKVVDTPDLNDLLDPIWDYKPKNQDLRGGVVIYERPVSNPPKGLYKIGFDPYRQQNSTMDVPSLAAIYVYKSNNKFSFTGDTIVAQYIGRPGDPDDVNRIAELLCEFYNAELMFENEVTHVKDYFVRKKKVHLLAAQPDTVISKLVQNSKTDRTFGIHMVEKIKDGGEKYIKQWLLTVRDFDETGRAILNLETIYDIGLLEELILYNRKGNFDRVMGFMMVMFQLAADEDNKEYVPQDVKNTDLLDLMSNQFKNTPNAFFN